MGLMKPSVYIETSVVSALVDERLDPFTQTQRVRTIDWWQTQRSHFKLYYSSAVLEELTDADFPGQRLAIALLQEMELLPVTSEIIGIAKFYQEHFLMPKGTTGDAVHLAIASFHEIDYLLTWNCKHLANTNKIHHIQVVNMRLGLWSPTLVTPEILRGEDDEA